MANHKLVGQTFKKDMESVMSDAFGRYAKYIIQDRALPDVRDGLKPVQRRIIYAMYNLGVTHDHPHKKSARSVGEVMGKYHPHGDSSIYEAMVRMSQDWKNNLTLIDMQGCNGSLDGDDAAAMRYTESRLTLFSEIMIQGIEKQTVELIPNYDGSEIEPTVLPSLLPNLLINGASGIAAGYATAFPPFNPNEVFDAVIARIDSPNCRIETIKNIMPGPDFPTGGIILNPEGIDEAYTTGKGKIMIRAKMELRNKKQIYITELPYEVNKAQLIDEIQELGEKYEVLNISDCHDETDENGVSICINLKSSENYDFVSNFIYKNTNAQIAYSINMTAIKDRKPYTMPILFTIDAFINHVNDVTIKATKFNLEKANIRKEIIIGLIKAIKIVDEVVALIRRSEDKNGAVQALINKLAFTPIQADAIVNLRLYRLSNTDVKALEKELAELNIKIAEYEMILKDKTFRDNYIKSKLREYKKLLNHPRRSTFSNDQAVINIDQADVIEDRDNYIVVTRDGYVKNIPTKSFLASEYQTLKVKEGDLPIAQFKSNQRHKLILITNKGRYIVLPVFKITTTKWKENGIHINTLVNINGDEKIINACNYENNLGDDRIFTIATKNRMIKRTKIEDLNISKLTKISPIINLDETDEVIGCIITSGKEQNQTLFTITTTGKGLVYPADQISITGKNSAGVTNTGIKDEQIAAIGLTNKKDYLCIICNSGMKRIKLSDLPTGNRTNTPKSLIATVKSNPIVVLNAVSVNQNDLICYVDQDQQWHLIKASEVAIGNRDTRVSSISKKEIIFGAINEQLPGQSSPNLFDN